MQETVRQFYLDWGSCGGQTEWSVVMLAVLTVEVETHQAGVGVILRLSLSLDRARRVHGTKMSERLHFRRLTVRFHLEKLISLTVMMPQP